MVDSRLYQLFDSFSKKEIRELKKFVHSPFFNQRDHVSHLFDYLVECKFERKQIPTSEQAFGVLFPKTTYDDHKLRLSMSLLNKTLEKYLVWQQVEMHHTDTQIMLARAFRQHNLPRHFLKTVSDLKKQQGTNQHQNADYYQNQYELYLEEYLFQSEQKRMEDLKLEKVQENLDTAYITSKLRQSCFLVSHQTIYNKTYDFGMLPQMLAYIEERNLLDIPAISVYYYCYRTLTDPGNYALFEQFKALIFKYQDRFPKGETRDLFLLAANYCIRLMNQGERRFAQEGLSIYKEGLKNEVLLLNGVLSPFTYRNILAKAIVSKEFDWAENFIHDYRDYLAEKYRESTYSFNLAWLEYERKNYDKALQLLHKANFTDLLLNLSAKTIAMKIYYELDAFDLLYSHLEAMKKFITRQEIIAYHRKNYLNTIKFTKKLLDLPVSDRSVRAKLKQEIELETSLAEKNWLLSQVA